MKSLIAILLVGVFALTACSPDGKKHNRTAPTEKKGGGGVDVGNMNGDSDSPIVLKTVIIPETEVLLSVPEKWGVKTVNKVLALSNSKGSILHAKKVQLDLQSVSQESLKIYLQSKNPSRSIEKFETSDLKGVRVTGNPSDLGDTYEAYLLTPLKKVVKISAQLNSSDNGIQEAGEIIATARTRYLGKAYVNEPIRTIELEEYFLKSDSSARSDYSFKDDCFPRQQNFDCSTYSLNFHTSRNTDVIDVQNGRIIDLGHQDEMSFDSIRVEGEFLVSQQGSTPISDIYKLFKRSTPLVSKNEAEVKEGHIYLVRVRDWPTEDIVVKLRVEEHSKGESIRMSYQKLTYIEEEVLQKKIDEMIEHTKKNEQPKSTGEVVLFNRSVWHNYHNSAFSFEYSNSGNVFITRNSWDIYYEQKFLNASSSSYGYASIVDLGNIPLESVISSDFPEINSVTRPQRYIVAEEKHTYLITKLDFSGNKVLGAVKVLEINNNDGWIRLQFKRVFVGPHEEFQQWIPLEVSSELKIVEYEVNAENFRSTWQVFEDQANKISEPYFSTWTERGWDMGLDSRPYVNWNGMSRLGRAISLEDITVASFSNSSLKFEAHLRGVQAGEVILIRVMGFYEKYLVAIKILEASESKLKFQTKYLFHGKAPFQQR